MACASRPQRSDGVRRTARRTAQSESENQESVPTVADGARQGAESPAVPARERHDIEEAAPGRRRNATGPAADCQRSQGAGDQAKLVDRSCFYMILLTKCCFSL